MKDEIISSLQIKSDGIYVDATLGYAGMSKEILKKLETGLLIGIDEDEEAIKYADNTLKKIGSNYRLFQTNFVNLQSILASLHIAKIDGIIFDLGFSSPQVDDEKRGFSFMKDAPLDMRMNLDVKVSAKDVINNYSENDLTNIFFQFGEEKMGRVIAKSIVRARKEKEINTTLELVAIIKGSVGANYFFKNHPERKIFQALRIEVNHELDVLKEVLPVAINALNKGGRISVITFHSLEDRIVKDTFRKYSEVPEILKGIPNIPNRYKPLIKIVNKKVIVPTAKELQENSRSHSAKLRIGERI